MAFQLWDWDSGNAIGEYESEQAALRVIHDTVLAHGREAVATFGLLRVSRRGRSTLVAEGEVLVSLAQEAATHQAAGTAPSVAIAT
jgi:hypothetical protein